MPESARPGTLEFLAAGRMALPDLAKAGPADAASGAAAVDAFAAAAAADPYRAARKLETLKRALAAGGLETGALDAAIAAVRARLDEAQSRRLDRSLRRAARALGSSREEDAVAAAPAVSSPQAAALGRLRPSRRAWLPATPEALRALDARLAEQEKATLQSAETDAARFFLRLREAARASRLRGGDFRYPVFEPVLKRILIDLALRLHEEQPAADREAFSALLDEGQVLLARGVPYKATMRLVFRYLETLDGPFVRRHPHLAGSFHRDHAEHVLEPTLDRGPDVLLFPSFRSIGVNYFVNTRGAPFHVVGLHPSGLREGEAVPFADGYEMKPSEFAWHDVGHVEFMAMRDFEYADASFKPLERIVQEWDLTRRRVVAYWRSFKQDKDLYDAMGLILFEILHERGYQYSFAVLKAQLDTPKWTEILLRKRDHDYYRTFPKMNMALFPRLEQAREKLLRFVDDSRRADQKRHVAALYGEELAVRVTHFPKARYGRGRLLRIELEPGADDATVVVRDEGGQSQYPKAAGLILAQVSPTRSSPFDAAARAKIGLLLGSARALGVAKIVIDRSKKIQVVMTDRRVLPLEQVSPPASAKAGPLDRHFFELDQVLGADERGQTLSYTMQDAATVHLGTVKYGVHLGEEVITIRDAAGREVTHPLAEVLVDPLQKQDFARRRRR